MTPRSLLRLVLVLTGALSAAAPGASDSASRPTYALIIANNRSLDAAQADLRFADDDGARFHALLSPLAEQTHLLAVLDPETQRRHPGLASLAQPPTRRALAEALAELNAHMKADRAAGKSPVLFFVFTGHGKRGPAGEGMIALWDGYFTRTQLFDQVLAPSQASLMHVVVDACDSYFFVNARGGLPVGPSYATAVQERLASRELDRYPHVGVVLSTSQEQESHEWSAISAGVFSHQVRSALAGAADVNGDGKVEYSELGGFIAAANQGVDDVRGQLDVFIRPPSIDRSAPLVDLRAPMRAGFLLLPEALFGRMWVEDERGVRQVELHKEPGRSVVLALPPAGGFFLRTATREAKFALDREGDVVDAAALKSTGAALAARGAVQDAFAAKMFGTPFGRRFYAGYAASLGEAPVTLERLVDATP